MSKQYRRGKTANKFLAKTPNFLLPKFLAQTSVAKTLIVRGIGYRSFVLNNNFLRQKLGPICEFINLRPLYTEAEQTDLLRTRQVGALELTNGKYVIIRAGHTQDLCVPLRTNVRGITSKKDRKLVIAADSSSAAANLAKYIHTYRPPSVYTGRGVRIKHAKPVRKAGKKDKQKGRAF